MITKQEQQMLDRTKQVLSPNSQIISHTYFSNEATKETGVDILFAKNSPNTRLLTCTTLGLINYDIGFKNGDKDIRIELVGVSMIKGDLESADLIARILSTAAFGIMENKFNCGLGTVFQNILEGYLPGEDMKHLVFINPPPFWKERFGTIELEDFTLTWLFAQPVSDAELNYLKEKGLKALLDLFVEKNINAFDLNRKSIL
ncbi:MAG: suppressor of fused domain protein [Oscillospiraceae bacterium]